MVSTFTANVNIEEPARGDDVGTWDTPVNNNMTLLDLIVGANTTIPCSGSNIVLSAAQFKSRMLTFNSTLTASITVTFPTTFFKDYKLLNLCTGTSAFTITCQTGAGQVICPPNGNAVDVYNNGTNITFIGGLKHVGEYWDYAGTTVPNWVTGCTVPPYLNCDGTTYSSATYPQLNSILGSSILPDSKGRTRFALDQSAGRISSGAGGFTSSGPVSNTGVGAAGGGQTTTLGTSNLPAYTPSGTVTVSNGVNVLIYNGTGSAGGVNVQGGAAGNVTASFTGSAQGGVSQAFSNLPPAFIGGIIMIRAG